MILLEINRTAVVLEDTWHLTFCTPQEPGALHGTQIRTRVLRLINSQFSVRNPLG